VDATTVALLGDVVPVDAGRALRVEVIDVGGQQGGAFGVGQRDGLAVDVVRACGRRSVPVTVAALFAPTLSNAL
jgi:hypothetical protein